MPKQTLPDHDVAKRAAQQLLKSGLASYAEVAALTGKSRQGVRKWGIELGAETARQDHLEKIWREALRQNR